MRTSAKVNLFLGARNLSEEFLPPHLRYMESFFRRRAVNLLFPVSVTVASLVPAMLLAHALHPSTSHAAAVGTGAGQHHAGCGHSGTLDAGCRRWTPRRCGAGPYVKPAAGKRR